MPPKLAVNGSCEKFEKETGQVHETYTRNNKIFCRIKRRFAKTKPPKVAVNGNCEKFENETGKVHKKNTRGNEYCRIKSRFAKRKTIATKSSSSKVPKAEPTTPSTPSPKTPSPKTPSPKAEPKTPSPKTPSPKAEPKTPSPKTPSPKAFSPMPKVEPKTPSPKTPSPKAFSLKVPKKAESKAPSPEKKSQEFLNYKSPHEECLNSTEEQLRELAYLLRLDDFTNVCGKLHRMRFQKVPSINQIKLVAKALDVKLTKKFYKDKKSRTELLDEIEKITKNNLKASFQRWVSIEARDDDINWVVLLLANIILPENYPAHAELAISEDQYKYYFNLLGREKEERRNTLFDLDADQYSGWKHIDQRQRGILRSAFVAKFSSCVSKFAFRNRALSLIKGLNATKFNPKEFCQSQVLSRMSTAGVFTIPFDNILISECDKSVLEDIGMN